MINLNARKFSFGQTLLLVLVSSIIISLGALFASDKIIINLPGARQEKEVTIEPGEPLEATPTPPTPIKKDRCISGDFEEHKNLWEVDKYFKVDEEGYYCPMRRGYQFWEIWYTEKLPVGFTSATLRYLLKDGTPGNDIPPPAVFSYGDNNKRFYTIIIPDGDLKSVRFKGEEGAAKPQGRLKEEMNINNEMIITIKPRVLSPTKNEIKVTFDLTYISKVSGDQMPPEPFEYDTKVPAVSPEEEGAKKQFGLGTFNGDCIKPIWFEICP